MKKKIIFTLAILVLVFGVAACLKVQAGTGENGAGWPWGGSEEAADGTINGNETGVGWISMNSTNCDKDNNGFIDVRYCDLDNNTFLDVACGGNNTSTLASSCGGNNTTTPVVNYGVNIPTGDGNFSGPGYYAWSENIGWVSFDSGDIAGCPDMNCISQRVGNNLAGWARIVGIKDALAAGNSGGWQGWLKLNGTNYGVSINGTNLQGYAWSDELGWIDFSKATLVTPSTLKICRDFCDSASKIDNGSTVTMTPGGTANLKACFNPDAGCGTATGDVTADVATVWTANNTPNDAVSLSGTDPKILTANSEGSEGISASYNSQTSSFTATVVLPCICSCEANTCKGSTCNNSCGNSVCSGTKNCNADYKEVAP